MPNDIFLNRCSAERYFPKSSYSRTSFSRICVQPSVISFSRNVTSANRCFVETPYYRIVCSPKRNITKRNLTELSYNRIVELPKLHNTERYFSESLFSRTLFFRIVVQRNVIFTNRRIAERHFRESSFSRASFSRNIGLGRK